jgi:hypothetical protein
MERLSVDYGEKLKLKFAIYPAPEVRLFLFSGGEIRKDI